MIKKTSSKVDLVADSKELSALCKEVASSEYLAIDTEFLRDRTYYPVLCVVQVASSNKCSFAVDMLAKDVDFKPLFDLLFDENILKVFHSGRQDLDILYNMSKGKIPGPIFDTQVAAMVLGYGESVSYAKLVQDLLGVTIDKAMQFTDWGMRPLLDKQIQYAIEDVVHLCEVYEKLLEMLKEKRREHWIIEEMEKMVNPEKFVSNPDEVWLKVKPRNQNPTYLARLKYLFKWREEEAMSLDVPRTRIIKDQAILDIALANPSSSKEIETLRSTVGLRKKYQEVILDELSKINKLPASQLPKPLSLNEMDKGKEFPILGLLKLLLKIQCKEYDVAEKLIATNEDLKNLVLDNVSDHKCMHGWRYEVFGKKATDLKNGRIGLKADGDDIKVYRVWF